jgi:hypothetical protein
MICYSCQKEIELEYPTPEPKLVVNCLFSPDSLFKVRVGKILAFNDTSTSFIVENAECEIFENGVFSEKLKYQDNGFYISEFLTPKSGNTYELIVSAEGFPIVSAIDTVPYPVNIENLYFELNTLYDALDETYFNDINIIFNDNQALYNYYQLKLICERISEDSTMQKDNLIFEKTNDLTLLNTGLIEYQPTLIPFSDILFNGQNYFLTTFYKLPFAMSDGENVYYETHNIIVYFNSISYQYYQYSRKMIMHIRNQESDIFEGIGDPVEMYSNIQNGYGIFAAYCPHTDTLHHELIW